MNPTVKELRTYVPAKDFELSKQFSAALGFEVTEAWGGNFACPLGGTIFRLQNYYVGLSRAGVGPGLQVRGINGEMGKGMNINCLFHC